MVLRACLHFHLGASHGSYKPRQNIYFWNRLWSENRLVGLSFTLLQVWGALLWKPDKTSVYQLIGEMQQLRKWHHRILGTKKPLVPPLLKPNVTQYRSGSTVNVNCNGCNSNNAAISENNVLFLQNQAFRKEMHPIPIISSQTQQLYIGARYSSPVKKDKHTT